MKLVYKGVFRNNDQLPEGGLPEGAVKFREPDSMPAAIATAMVFVIPAALLIALCMAASYLLHGELHGGGSWVGALAALLMILPHELLHALCFGKDAEVWLFVAPKQLSAFVASAQPVTKARFIFLNLLPNLLFGWLPLLVWTLLPYNAAYSGHLFSFAVVSILCGIADYMNAFNAARQMPRGSMQQISGFNSYWYVP
jgi:hypothetical protein